MNISLLHALPSIEYKDKCLVGRGKNGLTEIGG